MKLTKIFFLLLLGAFIFLRFYQLSERISLGWDQADSAWAAKSILVDNPVRLEGVPIKGNAGMFMGPLYYYLITPFYFFTGLDMIAAPIFAGVVSVVSFLIFYYISAKLFTTKVALIASVLYTFSAAVISADRVQAAFVLIPIVSYAVFYFLYKVVTGNEKYILYLAAAVGFGFHIHFTTAFYIPIILLTLPFFPRTKKTLLSLLLALPIFLLFISPMLYPMFFTKQSGSSSIVSYLNTSYHGLHLRRVLQLSHDGFISFQTILQLPILRPLVFFVLPLFAIVFYRTKPNKERKEALLLSYLMALWIVIPWILLATYTGELTDYYFSLPRNLGIVMLAFLAVYMYEWKSVLPKLLVISLLTAFIGYNLFLFTRMSLGNYLVIKTSVENAVRNNTPIKFTDRDPLSYMYYVYTEYRKK